MATVAVTVTVNPVTVNYERLYLLLGGFLFGTEIGGAVKKETTLYITTPTDHTQRCKGLRPSEPR